MRQGHSWQWKDHGFDTVRVPRREAVNWQSIGNRLAYLHMSWCMYIYGHCVWTYVCIFSTHLIHKYAYLFIVDRRVSAIFGFHACWFAASNPLVAQLLTHGTMLLRGSLFPKNRLLDTRETFPLPAPVLASNHICIYMLRLHYLQPIVGNPLLTCPCEKQTNYTWLF